MLSYSKLLGNGYAIPERIGDFSFAALATRIHHASLRWIFVVGQTDQPGWVSLSELLQTESDPQLGERMCAFVELRPGKVLTLQELTSFLLQEGIARFKLPERLELLSELPLSKVGKVLKQALIQQAKEFTENISP